MRDLMQVKREMRQAVDFLVDDCKANYFSLQVADNGDIYSYKYQKPQNIVWERHFTSKNDAVIALTRLFISWRTTFTKCFEY